VSWEPVKVDGAVLAMLMVGRRDGVGKGTFGRVVISSRRRFCLRRDRVQRRPEVSLGDSAVSFGAGRRPSSRSVIGSRVGLLVLALVAVVWFGWVYYSAAAETAGNDLGLFIVGGFDSGGFVTVDKPPAGLWLPAIVGRVFGGGASSFVAANAVLAFAAAVAVGATSGRRWRLVTVLLVLSPPGFAVSPARRRGG